MKICLERDFFVWEVLRRTGQSVGWHYHVDPHAGIEFALKVECYEIVVRRVNTSRFN